MSVQRRKNALTRGSTDIKAKGTDPSVYIVEIVGKVTRQMASRQVKETNLRLKRAVFAAYGNKCACCGERHEEFLTIDHIGGNKVTPRYAKHPHSEYRYIRDLGYPKDKYRLLCMNCNFAMKYGKTCPHKRDYRS